MTDHQQWISPLKRQHAILCTSKAVSRVLWKKTTNRDCIRNDQLINDGEDGHLPTHQLHQKCLDDKTGSLARSWRPRKVAVIRGFNRTSSHLSSCQTPFRHPQGHPPWLFPWLSLLLQDRRRSVVVGCWGLLLVRLLPGGQKKRKECITHQAPSNKSSSHSAAPYGKNNTDQRSYRRT